MRRIILSVMLISIMLVSIARADFTNRIKELEDENVKLAAQINQGNQQITQITQSVQQLSVKYLQNQAIITELTEQDSKEGKKK